MTLLMDCYRALKPGGHIRLALPDLDKLMRDYKEDAKYPAVNESFRDEFGAVFYSRGELFNIAMRAWGHTYMYNREDIEMLLRFAGFMDVWAAELGVSEFPLLHNREAAANESGLITEGRKPGWTRTSGPRQSASTAPRACPPGCAATARRIREHGRGRYRRSRRGAASSRVPLGCRSRHAPFH